MDSPSTEFFLYRYADVAWREGVRPWLEAARGRLIRSYVVVPTRGQAQALKQRCIIEGVPLLGVEFLSPGLARKKWLTLGGGAGLKPALGRELLLLGLGVIVERRREAASADTAEYGLLQSLQSDLEQVLDDFDELLRAGLDARGFAMPLLRDVFAELVAWVDGLGYDFAPRQAEVVSVAIQGGAAGQIGGRVLAVGMGPEMRGEFFNIATFLRGFTDITVLLPEPEFHQRQTVGIEWAELWEKLLGVPPLPLSEDGMVATCERAIGGWLNAGAVAHDGVDGERAADVLVGLTRGDEMRLVAEQIEASLSAGAESIGVVFPRADAAHFELATLLQARGVAFVDQLGVSGPPSSEVQLARGLLDFYGNGARLEEMLVLWPWLKAVGRTELSLGAVRDVCERLFEERQSHEVSVYQEILDKSERTEWRELGAVVRKLLPAWPEELTLADALARFGALCAQFEQEVPAGWGVLGVFAQRETRALPLRAVVELLRACLAEKSPAVGAPGRNGFARVTLTSRRRAEGAVWSHLFLVEANAGVWPERKEPSCWLTDEQRIVLNTQTRPGLGLFTNEERVFFEKQGYASLVRDTTGRVVFSAALFNEQATELKLAPNSWLERLLWAEALAAKDGTGLEELFERRARAVSPDVSGRRTATARWLEIYGQRRDPQRPFDEYFFSADAETSRPEKLPARLIERGIADPAELWFAAVLGVKRIEWAPFVRVRKKALGQLAHRVLAVALRTPAVERVFGEMPTLAEAQVRVKAQMEALRRERPEDRYWESFHAELETLCEVLLGKVMSLDAGNYVATEVNLPTGATIPIGPDGARFPVYGRVDLVRIDRPDWAQARVDVVDFKTGKDAKLTAAKMGKSGKSLQLGIYLEAMRSVGAPYGRVYLLKPDADDGGTIDMTELPEALRCLSRLGQHLASGVYGAKTPEYSPYMPRGCAWPLAMTPVAEQILAAKYAVTFGEILGEEDNADE